MHKKNKMSQNFFDLSLRVSLLERQFAETCGVDVFNYIRKFSMDRDRRECCGCGFVPPHTPESFLFTHIISINQENIWLSPAITLCNACHLTQHIDISIVKNYIKFVNSSFAQFSLIRMCRDSKSLSDNYKNRRIIDLSVSSDAILNTIKEGKEIDKTIKIVYTENFPL